MVKSSVKKTGKNQRVVAVAEIFILVIAVFAFSYFLAGSIPSVSAQAGQCTVTGIPISQAGNPNQWCRDNGRDSVCTGGSNNWQFITRACPGTESVRGISVVNDIGVPALSSTLGTLSSQELSKLTASGEATATTAGSDLLPIAEGTPAKKGLAATLDPASGQALNQWLGYIAANAAVAFGIKTLTQIGLGLIPGVDPKHARNAGLAVGGGYLAGAILAKTGLLGTKGTVVLGIFSSVGLLFAGAALLASLFIVKQSRYDSVAFSCNPWQAPSGGANCELCNDQEIPCTEYRCKSLGQSCELINRGTDNELCIFQDRDDVSPAVIEPWESALTDGYSYTPDGAINPPNRGVEIVRDEGDSSCVAPFTPLEFGVTLDKNARCKIVPESGRANTFEDMQNIFMTRGLANESHSFRMSLPSHQALAAENISYQHGGEISLYVKCETPQGYSNTADFSFRFCVDEGPDTEEPILTDSIPSNNTPIAFNQPSISASIFINEPAECRWSRLEQSYDDMPAENQMDCPESFSESTGSGDYRCNTELTGLVSREDNDFYISCKDQPWLEGTEEESQRNFNEVPYLFRIIGTQPLVLDSATPNETTISDSTDIIEVILEAETSAGFNRGAALCSFSRAGENRFSEFRETGTHEHSQSLFLDEGEYSYDIKCIDAGGNADSTQISFNVETDTQAPTVVRAFRDSSNLKIITDEGANCVYDTVSCSYGLEDGIQMDPSNEDRAHSTSWESNRNFYIKCEDEFGNQPNPDQCSIVVRPFDVQ